ncbi:Type I phosphodiesterase / nucleotide pyrophosphatase [Verrucomicrobium sp. GAS474]|uniref:alkaline phosphatase family protein n=1 Tax=Verrucomicrobium sp. GAS474 TaxID=1882831 RepID=UPI00087BF4F2|nr:alkaline phosphatase family protein [Verrucomicrobium sp. GAS474]SDT98253.1 Type I phosphodiesterase / nucleotide pyrophosphatase [Verrucomicrobium sp. GAS474]
MIPRLRSVPLIRPGLALALVLALLPAVAPAQQAEHVVLVVWSGLRPDAVTETLTPTLFRLAQEGTRFSRHHAVYPTTPLVNGIALLTGAYPGRSGIYADKAYLPALDAAKPVPAAIPAAVRMGDALSDGHYLTVATLPELLQAGDRSTAVVGAGLLPFLADRRPEEGRASTTSSVVYAATIAATPPAAKAGSGSSTANSNTGSNASPSAVLPLKMLTVPAALGATLEKLLKPLPPSATPNSPQDRWMTRALLNGVWAKEVPAFSCLWLTDPAAAQRENGLGDPNALLSIHAQDENLRLILQALEAKGIRGKTDLFIVSDTGYSSVRQGIDVAADLAKAGFNATRKLKVTPEIAESNPGAALEKGKILVVGCGGTVLFYVGGHDGEVAERLLKFLQRSTYAGVLFSREARDGAFTLHQANLATGDWEKLPDVVLSMRWTAEANSHGVPGTALADVAGGGIEKLASNGTLSRFDLAGTLIASGPDIRSGWVDDLPTGNADLAPTIAGLLRLASPPWMDGRVLVEAVRDYPAASYTVDTENMTATIGAWQQTLRVSRINGAVYMEEGNGGGAGRGGVGEP